MFNPALHTPNPGAGPASFNRMTIVNVLEHIYGPVLVGLGFGYCFAFVDPAQEVILGFLAEMQGGPDEGGPSGSALASWLRTLTAILLLAAVPLVLAEAARRTVRFFDMGGWIPAFAVIAAGGPVTALIILGIRNAVDEPEANGITTQTTLFLGAGLTFFAIYGAKVLLNRNSAYGDERRSSYWSSLIFFALLIAAVVLVGFLYPEWGQYVGPISLAAGFAIGLGTLLALLTCASRSMPGGMPLLLLIVLSLLAQDNLVALGLLAAFGLGVVLWYWFKGPAAWQLPGNAPKSGPRRWAAWLRAYGTRFVPLVFAFFSLGFYLQQHLAKDCGSLSGCHLIAGVEAHPDPIPSASIAFEDWPYKEVPTIRIVAAQGGGLYAAYQTAFYLASRADADPDFAQSVFAISGVSGGAVGAGVYWAVRASGICQTALRSPNCHRDAVRGILRRDYLSPSLAGFFFRDNLDNFLPYSAYIHAPMDRGRVLEERLVTAVNEWEDQALPVLGQRPDPIAPDRLRTALSKSWLPEKGAPLLFMNGTEVGDGSRHPLSPVDRLDRRVSRLRLAGARDLTVANAMVISARFPLVTPPARLRTLGPGDKTTELLQLVDGGYFDNSGIETAVDIVRDIEKMRGTSKIELIAITVEEQPPAPSVKGTIGAPVSAFVNAWRARIELTARRATQLVEPDQDAGDEGNAVSICAARSIPFLANFTLSWYLAGVTFKDIEEQVVNGHLTGKKATDKGFNGRLIPEISGRPKDCPTGKVEAEVGRLKTLQRAAAPSIFEEFQFGPAKPLTGQEQDLR